MTSDLDIYRTADVLVKHYAEDAALEAAQRADAMLEKGCLDGLRVWRRVLAAVKEIQRREPQTSAVEIAAIPLAAAGAITASVSRRRKGRRPGSRRPYLPSRGSAPGCPRQGKPLVCLKPHHVFAPSSISRGVIP